MTNTFFTLDSGTSRLEVSTPSTTTDGPATPVLAGSRNTEAAASGLPSLTGRLFNRSLSTCRASVLPSAATGSTDELTVSSWTTAATLRRTRCSATGCAPIWTSITVSLKPSAFAVTA